VPGDIGVTRGDQSVREFGRAVTVPLGAPAGRLSAFIEVEFAVGENKLRPDGLIRVVLGQRTWTALVEVKTGRNELKAGQIESYLDLARRQKFDAVLTISNELVTTPGEHPVKIPKQKTQCVDLHHLSWSQIRTEALMAQANKAVSDPDQAWILAEFIRYLEHSRSGAIDFDDMGPSWVKVREGARTGTLHPQDKGVAEVADRFGHLISFAAMQLSRELSVEVSPALTPAHLHDPAGYRQQAASGLAATSRVHGSLRIPAAVAPIKITADLCAGLLHCAVTVPAPKVGRPVTRVNWLARQLKDAPAGLCIEAIAAWQHGKGTVKTLAAVRADPSVLAGDPRHELRAFTLSLTSNAGTARGQGHGSFVKSVLEAVDMFYADIVQRIKPWVPAPPKVREEETAEPALSVAQDARESEAEIPAGEQGEGQPTSTSAAGMASAWPEIQAAHMLPPCGGRIGLFGDRRPG
jgi:hypothetical protein